MSNAVVRGFVENDVMLSRFRPTSRRLVRLAGELVLFMIILLAMEWFLTRDAARGQAPPLQGMRVDGRPFDLRELQGRPALVYFWATWCPVCGAVKGAMDGLLASGPGVTVAMRSGEIPAMKAYLARERIAWPVINDPEGAIARQWGVTGVPAVFVLDAQGRVAFVTRGYTTQAGLRARLWLAGWR